MSYFAINKSDATIMILRVMLMVIIMVMVIVVVIVTGAIIKNKNNKFHLYGWMDYQSVRACHHLRWIPT